VRALTRRVRHIITTVSTVVFFFCAPVTAAQVMPSADDINNLAEAARSKVEKFMRDSFELRQRYEFSGKFLTSADTQNLHKLAKAAAERLHEIAQKQQNLSRIIEDYEGDDWETRYGSTGLWRKLQGDRYLTLLSTCQIDYYLALSTQPPKRTEILREILSRIDSTPAIRNTARAQLLKAMTHALLARSEPANRLMANEQFYQLLHRSDMDAGTALRAAIERIKLLGPSEPDELQKLAEAILRSSRSDDIELVMSLACLQRRYSTEALRQTLSARPQIEDFLGSCILSELSGQIAQGQLDLKKTSAIEAELAACAARNHTPRQYNVVLQTLAAAQKFQSPLILYVAAIACADSQPAEAVELLIRAGRLQQVKKSNKLDIEAVEIAGQAAQLAYMLFTEARQHCPLVLDAFDNYALMAADQIDEQLEYLHTVVLNSCGRTQKAEELLQRIAARPAGKWRNRARLDLITTTIREQPQHKNNQSGKMLDKLSTLISDCNTQSESDSKVRTQALGIYCELLLQSNNTASAQKVLDAITVSDTSRDPNLNVCKSKALRRMGRLSESAQCLMKVCRTGDRRYIFEAEKLLSEMVEQIDLLHEQQADSPQFMNNCVTIARYCEEIALSTYGLMPVSQARLYLAEISLMAADEEPQSLLEADRLLDVLARGDLGDNVDYLRCRARLLTKQAEFDKAAELWAKIAEIRKPDPAPSNQRSWKWWRAKYYEIYCRSQCSRTDKKSLLHTIDVLENSFAAIPPPWAEKIRSVKQIRHAGDSVGNN